MPGIVEFPTLVQDALAQFGDIFANECQRRHFAEYVAAGCTCPVLYPLADDVRLMIDTFSSWTS